MRQGSAVDPSSLFASMPFAVAAGIEPRSASAEEVVGVLAWDPGRCTVGGVVHGGALMTLNDSVGAVCAFLNLPPGAATSTIESKTNLFRAVRSGEVVATAKPLHVGRTTIAVQVETRDDEGRLVALTVQTQAVLQPNVG